MENGEKLIFVFDADSSPENRLSLFLKRSLTPSKIECPLYRLMHDMKGIHPVVLEKLQELGVPYETLYFDQFIQKYEGFEIFGKFKLADVTYPCVYIIIGREREERELYELVASRYFLRCDSASCFSRILERKHLQFKELGPAEFKKRNDPKFKAESKEEEKNEKEEKKQKIENAQQKIADMEKRNREK